MKKPEFYNFAVDVVDHWAQRSEQPALWWTNESHDREQRLTFAQIADASRQLSGALQAGGLSPGDRVLLLVGRRPEWWIALTGLIRAGVVAVPGTTLLSAKDIAFRIDKGRIAGVIAEGSLADKVDQVREACPGLRWFACVDEPRAGWHSWADLIGEGHSFSPPATGADDPCLLFFTSGTTGPPKLVLHSHTSYPLGHHVTGREWLGVTSTDLHWNLSDTGWAKAAWSSYFGAWSQGATVFVQDPGPKFDAEKTLDVLQRYPITTFCAPPTVFRHLVRLNLRGRGLERLRQVVAAGEPLNPEVITIWKEATGTTIRDGYGQTETTLLVGNLPGRPVKPGSMGLPAPGFEVEILDDSLEPLPTGQEGEVAVRTRPSRPIGLFLGYENNPEENAAKFRGDYYLTGDRAFRDEEGYFWFVGRGDDVILSAGYRIGPFEVESALIEHPAVQEAAVVGVPDPDRYQIVKAFVVLCAGHSPSKELTAELKEHVKLSTAPYKYPREIEFVESLPKTISGKIRRAELRARS